MGLPRIFLTFKFDDYFITEYLKIEFLTRRSVLLCLFLYPSNLRLYTKYLKIQKFFCVPGAARLIDTLIS